MILELKGQGFKEPVAKGEKSLLKRPNTEEGTGPDKSASKWEKGQGTERPNGQTVHQKPLDRNIPEMIVSAKTQSLTDFGMELVFCKGLCVLEEGSHFKIYLFKVLFKLCNFRVNTNDSVRMDLTCFI